MALFFTMRITPSASVTVTTMGKPSGMAATARLKDRKQELVWFPKDDTRATDFDIVVCGPTSEDLCWNLDCRLKAGRQRELPDSDGEHVQGPLPLQPAHQHDDP